jgi:hypothetical protein
MRSDGRRAHYGFRTWSTSRMWADTAPAAALIRTAGSIRRPATYGARPPASLPTQHQGSVRGSLQAACGKRTKAERLSADPGKYDKKGFLKQAGRTGYGEMNLCLARMSRLISRLSAREVRWRPRGSGWRSRASCKRARRVHSPSVLKCRGPR